MYYTKDMPLRVTNYTSINCFYNINHFKICPFTLGVNGMYLGQFHKDVRFYDTMGFLSVFVYLDECYHESTKNNIKTPTKY